MTARSVRIENDTVTRPAGPWTPTVQAKGAKRDYLRFAPDDAFVRRSTNSW